MAMITTPMYIASKEAKESILHFCRQTVEASFNTFSLRQRFEVVDKELIRENNMVEESIKATAANAAGNKRKIQDIVIPIVEPQTMTALAYLSSVFLTGVPIFGIVSDLKNIEQAKMMEAVIANNSIYGGWVREFLLFLLDGLKYNFSAIEVDWCREKIWTLESDSKFSTTEGKPKEILWQGNKIKRLNPYNTFFDARVPITEQHKRGEFVGYSELHTRISLVEMLQALPFRMNYREALESSPINPAAGITNLFYIPQVFAQNLSLARMAGIMDWSAWAFGGLANKDIRIRFKNLYTVVTRYIKLIPSDHSMKVPAPNQPQIWKVITVNDSVIVYMERMTNAHGYMPIIFGQPTEDGLDLQTKSFAQKQIPLQDIASGLANAKMAAKRRLISDRMLYDPSRIRSEDINSDSPTAKIPVRPSAYGQPLEKAVHAIPFRDEQTQSLMADVKEVRAYADSISGQNQAQQGQFVKGNKTRGEYEDVQNKSSGRQVLMALLLESQVFTPIKHILKLNVLQYQPAGPLYSYVDKVEYNIDPIQLRQTSLAFKVSDGLVPSDKLIDGATMEVALQVIGSSEALQEEYSVGGLFAHLMGTRGVDLAQYKFTPQQVQERRAHQLAVIQAEGASKNAGITKGVEGSNPGIPGA